MSIGQGLLRNSWVSNPSEQRESLLWQCSVPVSVKSDSAVLTCDGLVHLYGNAGDRPGRARARPSDMTDAEWAAVRDLLPVPARMNSATSEQVP